MDQTKIGKFISDMGKKQGLTQKQLAEQLNVTDKTVFWIKRKIRSASGQEKG